MQKLWHDRAWEDYVVWQSGDKKTLRRINQLLQSIERNGHACIGKPEPQKENWSGWWSVRIDEASRKATCVQTYPQTYDITNSLQPHPQWDGSGIMYRQGGGKFK